MLTLLCLFRLFHFSLLAILAIHNCPAQSVQYGRVNEASIRQRLESELGSNKQRQQELQRIFEISGCKADTLQVQEVKGSRLPNLVCTLTGETDSIILIGAHFDAAAKGRGVVDNWSGAALLPTLYDSLSRHPRRHTFLFVGFTDEEKGLIGSKYFVKKLPKEQRSKIRAAVIVDSIGLGPACVWLSKSDPTLVRYFSNVFTSLKTTVNAVNADEVGSGDHIPFLDKKIPCLIVHSLTQETLPILHSPRDNIHAIKFDDYYDTYILLAAYLGYLDIKLE